jgi:hypothetical protein
MNLDIIHDKLSIVGKIYFQLLIQIGKFVFKFTVIWTPKAPWVIEQTESSSILYENCQRMRIETVYTKKHIQLKIMIDVHRL